MFSLIQARDGYILASRRRPICTTKPEPSFNPSRSSWSGTLHTWKLLWNVRSQASKTMWERSCWAMTHIVGVPDSFDFGKLHKSAQVWTNGPMSASLNTQSHAKMISMSVFLDSSDDLRPSRFGIISQSKAMILILLNVFGWLWTADLPPLRLLLLTGLGLTIFSAMLSFSVLKTYSWSVAMYVRILGETARPTIPEIPHPSSRAVVLGPMADVLNRTLSSDAIQSANRGVIFQTTVGRHSKTLLRLNVRGSPPAPVVPPFRLDDKIAGDCWMISSLPATTMSRIFVFGSMKPRFWDGTACENKRNDSDTSISSFQPLTLYRSASTFLRILNFFT